jgi:hypothetical protein
MPDNKPDPGELQIRNQRYRPWRLSDIVAATFLAMIFFGTIGGLIFPRGYGRLLAGLFLVGYVGLGTYMLYLWFVLRVLRGLTARALFRWVFLGIRQKELNTAGNVTARSFFGWLIPSRFSVYHLKLGEEIEIEPLLRISAQAVKRVRFVPDPAEDYRESNRASPLCQAFVELHSDKKFHLIVTETDAQRLRNWAVAKGVAVCNSDGYRPRIVESATEA